MGELPEKQKTYFVVGIGSLLETKSGNKTESPKRTQYCGRLKPAGDPCGELKGSSTAAHNTCHHSSIRAFPSMRTSHPWLLAPLSISSVSKGCRIPMVGLPVQSWKGSHCWCDEPCRFSPAVHCIPLAGKISSPESSAGFGNLDGVNVAPPGLHPQKFALWPLCIVTTPLMLPDLMDTKVCTTILLMLCPHGLQWCLWGRGIVKTLNFIQPKSYNRANIIVWCKVLSNPQQGTAWSCSVSFPSLFGVTTGTPLLCVGNCVQV